MHRTDKYSQHGSIVWRVWLNDCVRLRTKWLCVQVPLLSPVDHFGKMIYLGKNKHETIFFHMNGFLMVYPIY